MRTSPMLKGPRSAGTSGAAVVFQAIGGTAAHATPVTTAMPAGVVSGNLLISMALLPAVNAVFSISAGWTILEQVNAAGFSAAIAYRVATGTGDAPTWSWTGGGNASTNVSRYTGNITGTPIGNHSQASGSGTTALGNAITAAGGGTFMADISTATTQNIPTPTGWTNSNNFTGTPAEHIVHKDVPLAGTNSGAPSVTITSAAWIMFIVELRSQ